MNPLAELIAFCRTHGTPKLRVAPEEHLRAHLAKALRHGHLVRAAGPGGRTAALGIAWPCSPEAPLQALRVSEFLYVANLCATGPRALGMLMLAAHERWPRVRAFLADRVPKRRREDPTHAGHPQIYGPRQSRLLWRLAARRLEPEPTQ